MVLQPLLKPEGGSVLSVNAQSEENANSDEDSSQSDCEASSSLPSLRGSLAVLYGLQGVTMQLPILALLAVVNDRVAIPPAYLSAYGAICFLPSSLKPLWAMLTSVGMSVDAKPTDKIKRSQSLLAVMLFANGLSFCGTALLIPLKGIVECFAWGLLRGITNAWANFLTDQLLILDAKTLCCDEASTSSYQAISSNFQAKAATYRKAGALLASIGSFGLFLWRQTQRDSDDNEPTLSTSVVMALLFGSGAMGFLGAAVLILQRHHRINSHILLVELQQSLEVRTVSETSQNTFDGNNERLWNRSSQYRSLSIEEDRPNGSAFSDQEDHVSRANGTESIQKKSDVTTLGLLQLLLIGGAVRRPVASLEKGMAIWEPTMVLLSILFIAAAMLSTFIARRARQHKRVVIGSQESTSENDASETPTIPPRSLGLYLIIRYSVPIASFLMYAYVYDIFGKDEPLFMQTLLILESGVALFSSWVYTRFFSDRCHSGWAMIVLLAAFTIITSLVSLLDVWMVHARNSKHAIDADLRWIVASITLVKYFMGNINHLPAIVLATANIVSPSEESENNQRGNTKSQYDEGIQYATFISCINFGAQIGDWISVPIIATLGISRENNWANLDKFIILCAGLRMFSIFALCLIRPPQNDMLVNAAAI